jgi:hypothetical protein
MKKSQHLWRGSPSGADPRTAQKLSQRRRAVREKQQLGRCAYGQEMSERKWKRSSGHTANRGSGAETNLTDGDAASGEDKTREPWLASGEHTRRTGGANEMMTRNASGGALREKAVRKSAVRNPRPAAARLLRAVASRTATLAQYHE